MKESKKQIEKNQKRWCFLIPLLYLIKMTRIFSKKYPKGFNFIEMMTALGIAGVLGVTGINSYRKQRHQARSAQAQYNLSNIYSAEKNFYTQWQTYHENLYIIGAIPEGELWYDVGFTEPPSNSGGNLAHYPWQDRLVLPRCNTFYEICNLGETDNCAFKMSLDGYYNPVLYGNPGPYHGRNYQGFACKVIGDLRVSGPGYGADETSFKALATAKLNTADKWTINHKQEVTHTEDGTGN